MNHVAGSLSYLKLPALLRRRIHWLNFPTAILIVLLQRMPVISALFAEEEMVLTAPAGVILKSAVAAVAALGAVNSMAGATPLSPSSGTATGVSVAAGSNVSIFYTVNGTQTPPQSWSVSGSIPPGLNFSGLTDGGGFVDTEFLNLSGTPTTPGTYHVSLMAFEFTEGGGINSPGYNYTITVTGNPTGTAPSITTQPASQSVNVGDQVTFTGGASGSPAPTFQWRKDGADIGGATGTSYTIPSAGTGDAGSYTLVATNSAGSATSNAASLTVNIPAVAPGITQQPQSQTITAGNPVTFTAAASGTPSPGFQWQKNGANIGGANGSSYTIPRVSVGDAGTYTVVASNVAGSATSNGATLTVTSANTAPVITANPQSQTVASGNPVTFSATASGSPAPSFQWQKDGVNIGGATGVSFSIGQVGSGDAGSYRVVATNAVGSATSAIATLTVTLANGIRVDATTFPATITQGTAVNFTATVTNSGTKPWGPNHFLMFRDAAGNNLAVAPLNGVSVNSSTLASLSFSGPVTPGNYTYYLMGLENGVEYFGSSAALNLTVTPTPVPPAFTTQPQAALVAIGGGVTLTAAASGTPAPTYQWRRNGTNIAGATSSSYTIANASFGDVGSYTVVATNSVGSATSQAALVQLKSGGNVDFNGDGHPDLVWQNRVTGQRAIWTMNGTTPVNSVPLINIPIEWDLVGTADFNGDGKPDLIWQNTTTGERAIWLMDGTTPVASRPLITIPLEWDLVGATDFNGDGKPDLLWQNTVTGQRAIWIMDGTTPVSSVPLINIPIEWDLVGTADFNGDGKPDLIWQNTTTGERAIWLMDGTTPVASRPLITIPLEWDLVGARDFDGDGKPDLLWQNKTTGERAIWLMDGTTPIASRPLITIPTEWVLVK